jgi:hypothetical protein
MYRFECICGETVTTAAVTGRCPHCARLYVLDCQAEYKPQAARGQEAADPPLFRPRALRIAPAFPLPAAKAAPS